MLAESGRVAHACVAVQDGLPALHCFSVYAHAGPRATAVPLTRRLVLALLEAIASLGEVPVLVSIDLNAEVSEIPELAWSLQKGRLFDLGTAFAPEGGEPLATYTGRGFWQDEPDAKLQTRPDLVLTNQVLLRAVSHFRVCRSCTPEKHAMLAFRLNFQPMLVRGYRHVMPTPLCLEHCSDTAAALQSSEDYWRLQSQEIQRRLACADPDKAWKLWHDGAVHSLLLRGATLRGGLHASHKGRMPRIELQPKIEVHCDTGTAMSVVGGKIRKLARLVKEWKHVLQQRPGDVRVQKLEVEIAGTWKAIPREFSPPPWTQLTP